MILFLQLKYIYLIIGGRGNAQEALGRAKALGYDIYNSLDWVDAVDRKRNYIFPEESREYVHRIFGHRQAFNKGFDSVKDSGITNYEQYVTSDKLGGKLNYLNYINNVLHLVYAER